MTFDEMLWPLVCADYDDFIDEDLEYETARDLKNIEPQPHQDSPDGQLTTSTAITDSLKESSQYSPNTGNFKCPLT